MSQWVFVPPADFVNNISANVTYGRKTSACPMLDRPFAAADANMIYDVPIPSRVDESGLTVPLTALYLHHQISGYAASTSFSTGPIVSVNFRVYEVTHDAGGLSSRPVTVNLPNGQASAGFVPYPSGTNFTGTVTSAYFATGTYLDQITGVKSRPADGRVNAEYPYRPRLPRSLLCLELSATSEASAQWEIYGLWCQFG